MHVSEVSNLANRISQTLRRAPHKAWTEGIDRVASQGFLVAPAPEELGGVGLDLASQVEVVASLAKGSTELATVLAIHLAALNALLEGGETFRQILSERLATPVFGLLLGADNDQAQALIAPQLCQLVVGIRGASLAVFLPTTLPAGEGFDSCGRGLKGLSSRRFRMSGRLEPLASQESPLVVQTAHSRLKLLLAAVQVGNARAATEDALAYAQDRWQTGRMIIDHQNVRSMLTRMDLLVNVASSFVAQVAPLTIDATAPFDPWRQAYTFACEAAEAVCLDAVQVLGGYGYMEDYGQAQRLRDCKTLAALTSDYRFDALGIRPTHTGETSWLIS